MEYMQTNIPYYIGLLVLLVIVILFYVAPKFVASVPTNAQGPFSLVTQTAVLDETSSKLFYSDSEGTFSAFVYLAPMNRTGAQALCGTKPNQASCSDGTFAPCACEAASGDCSKCGHDGYKSVFNISGMTGLEVLTAPDASRQGKSMTQLIVKTEGASLSSSSSASQKYIETLTLPPIPLQKWTMVTVAREGRRFDVYYNDVLVLSQKTMSMPVSNISSSNFSGITSGSNGMAGQLALGNIYSYRMNAQEVSAAYAAVTDTRGRPYINSMTPLSADPSGLNPGVQSSGVNMSSVSLCPGCFSAPAIKPASPLYDWSTPYG
jgi:hypothetical protein